MLSTPWHIVPEGRSVPHTVWLSHQPGANVTVAVATSGDSDITASPASLTFTSANWSTPQTVILSAAQDTDTVPQAGKGDGGYAYGATDVTHTATSSDSDFNNVSVVLKATEGDDDVCSGTTAVGGSGVTSGAIVEDCDTLLAAKAIVNGSGDEVNNWSTGLALNSWQGITVANSRVTQFKMSFFFYVGGDGNLPNTITDLDALTVLLMESSSRAALPGPIPPGIGNLTALTALELDENQLSGPLPASMGNLSSLTKMWLENNRFSGAIPAELAGLTAMTTGDFSLDENRLTGCVPTGWSKYLSKINPQEHANGNDVNLALCANLTATVNSDNSVDLDLSGGPTNWWFRINSWGTCTAASGTSVNNIRGYQLGTHSVRAYSDSDCGYQIAATSFTLTASLAARVNSDRSVDLTLTNGPANWYFRISYRTGEGTGSGSCTAASGTTVSGIQGYKTGTYGVGAFSGAGCKNLIAHANFIIPEPPPSNASLTTTVNPGPAVDLKLTNGPNDWWFRIGSGTCTAVSGTDIVRGIQGYKAGKYSVYAYSDSGCSDKIAASSFTIPPVKVAATVDSADWSVDLTLTDGPANWRFRIGIGSCTEASGTTVSNIRGYPSGTHLVMVYPASGCAGNSYIATTTFTIPTATLTATVHSDRTVDLNLSNGPDNWWFRINSWGTCTATSSTSVNGIAGYKDGTHSVRAYSNSGCNYHVASSSFTLPP